jgi:hypothetical protein
MSPTLPRRIFSHLLIHEFWPALTHLSKFSPDYIPSIARAWVSVLEDILKTFMMEAAMMVPLQEIHGNS